jgi:hypothetical protein
MHNNVALKYCHKLIRKRNLEGTQQLSLLSNVPFTTSWHIHPTIAATEELSAPPERGSRKPDAPLLLK